MLNSEPREIQVREAAVYKRDLERRIHSFELQYEMTTDVMREGIATGVRPETAEISLWLYDANVLAHLSASAEKSMAGSGSTATTAPTPRR